VRESARMDATSDRLSFGPFRLDLARGELLNAGELVSLAPKPLALLAYLAVHRDRAVPKPELRKYIWPDVHVSEAALASALKDLRRALGDDGASQKLIRTMRRRGYRFVAKLDERALDRRRALESGDSVTRTRAAPFVARGRELRLLSSHAAQAARGRPRVLLIVGPAGAGKTRLIAQLVAHPVCSGFAAGTGSGAADESLPYAPFAEALRARLGAAGGPVESLFGEDAPLLRPLLQLDPPHARAPREPGSGARARAELFAAVSRWLGRLARQRPTVLALEDLHGADSASLDLFEFLVGALTEVPPDESLPLLLIATLRDAEGEPRLESLARRVAESPAGAVVSLDGVSVAATGRVIDALGLARPAGVTLQAIHAATYGNPLFIRELLRGPEPAALLASDSAEGYRAEPTTRLDGLRRAIAARVDRLRPASREILTAAAFLGERFGLLALCAVTRRDEAAVLAALAEAERAEFVTRERRSFRFDHPLMREVVRDALSERARREVHRDVATVLEDLYAGSPADHALEIARHLCEAGELVAPERLLAHAHRAAEHAASLCAWREAVRFHEAALSAGESLPLRERAELELRAGLAANHDYDADRALRHYASAADRFAEARDDAGLARALMFQTRLRFTFPEPSRAKLDLRPLEDLAARLPESLDPLRALVLETLSEAHWAAGEVELAEQAAERALALGERHGDTAVCHHARLALGAAKLSQLRPAESLEDWLEAAALARRSRDPWLEAAPGPRIALALLHLGRLAESRESARAAVESARLAHHAGELAAACAQLASLEGVTGTFAEAEHWARASLAALDRGRPWAAVGAHAARACAAAHRGDWADARASLDALVSPGTGGEKPGALVEFIAASHGEALAARRSPDSVDLRRVTGLVGALRSARLDPLLVGPLCALAEASEALREPELAVTPEAMLRHAYDRGITFSSGWVYLVPRVLARCAALRGRFDEAESLLERALEAARFADARVELGLSLADRARVARRRGARPDFRSARDLEGAVRIFDSLGMKPALRDALALGHSQPTTS